MSWQAFLAHVGATFDEAGAANFAAPAAAAQAPRLLALTHLGLIRFSGPETAAFLQGQLSSDISKLAGDGIQYSSYSTPKGRMLATFLLMREGDDYLLQLPASLLPAILKRLSMYVLRSKTRASDASEERVLLGLLGAGAADLLQAVFAVQLEVGHSAAVAGGLVARLSAERFQLCLEPAAAEQAWQKLAAAGAQAVSGSEWTLADIAEGIVWVVSGTQEEFVPQMANMELIDAVSFKKGCYPGQEIVARTQYLGKLKRRAYRMQLPVPALAGEDVYSPEMNGQPSGKIALVAASGEGKWEALVVAQIASVPHGLHLHSADGPALTLLELPYALPQA